MGTERVRGRPLLAGVLALWLGASGCVSSSIRSDVAAVRKLSGTPQLAGVRENYVEPGDAPEVKTLLEKPLDADAAVRLALVNNRELRARLRELGVARGRVMQAGLIANPVAEAEWLPERDSDLELRVEYEITSLLMAPLRKRAEAHELEAARIDVASDVLRLAYEVRTAFYALVAAEQRLHVAQRTLDALAASRDAAQALLEAGNVAPLDASVQIANYERARITVAQLELEVVDLREAMQRLLGLHGKDLDWKLVGELAPVPEQLDAFDDLETRALTANLKLHAAQERLEALARRTGVARTQGWLPGVVVDVHSFRARPEVPNSGDQWRWGGGVSLEVPLFDRRQGERRSYEAQFDALLERYQGLAVDVRSGARETRNRLVSAHARAKQYQEVILPAQRTVMQHALLQYNAMQLNVFQLLEARRELLEVELAYVDTLREYWSAHAAYEALLAGYLVTQPRAVSPHDGLGSAAAAPQGGH